MTWLLILLGVAGLVAFFIFRKKKSKTKVPASASVPQSGGKQPANFNKKSD